MKFHDYRTLYEENREKGESRSAFFERAKTQSLDNFGRAFCEETWIQSDRPYYSLYPVAEKMLRTIRLDIPCSALRVPMSPLLLRFAHGHEPCGKLAGFLAIEIKEHNGLIGFIKLTDDERLRLFRVTFTERTVEEVIQEHVQKHGDNFDAECFGALVRCIAGLSLLGKDSELIEPDVLDKDRARWEESHDPKYIDKAHRRGKKGWTIGAKLETTPHIRRPHFGIRWTEKGRSVPKLVRISGSVVMRKVLGEVPTGYLGDLKGYQEN